MTYEEKHELRFQISQLLADNDSNQKNNQRFGTSFRNNITDEEEAALDHLLDMMTAIKQQILLRRAMKEKSNVYRVKDNQEKLP